MRRARTRTTQPARAKKKTSTTQTRAARQAARKRVPKVQAAVAGSPSPDSTLLIGGLALVVLVLGDTILLALSSRFLRLS
jgi:hypothetical protein